MTALRGMQFLVGFTLATYMGMWSCVFLSVSFDRISAATSGSDSKPYVKASLQALPKAPAPAKIGALAVLEKEEEDADLE